MKRGAVVIGVNKYNDSSLQDLQGAVQGAKDFAEWAGQNGVEVALVTDEANPVTFGRVREALEGFTSRTGDQRLEQLLVFFSGHGFNRGFDETWLLSKATRDGNEAVNLASTIDMARYTTGIHHVVFMSDACRSAADTIDTQNIVGGMAVAGKLKPARGSVDRFYAARIGSPAQEVPVGPHGVYEAVYTQCVLEALRGAAIIERLQMGLQTVGIVTAKELKRYLEEAVPKRVVELKLRRAQDPDAIIESASSESPLYLSQLPLPSGEQRVSRSPPPGLQTQVALASWDRALLMAGRQHFDIPGQPVIVPELKPWRDTFNADSQLVVKAMGEDRLNEEMELRVQGAGVRAAQATDGVCETSPEGTATRVRIGDRQNGKLRPLGRPVSVLVEFDNGRGTVIAAMPRFGATLLMDRGELASVTYELPSYQAPAGTENERLRALRASVAAAARHGAFRIEDADARPFADSIRVMKGIDPTLGIYAAYAYHQIGLVDQIRSVAEYMREDLGGILPFDVEMLLRNPDSQPWVVGSTKAVPFCPMLTQGWALLPAKRVTLPSNVEAAGRHLARSLWTLFEPEGVRLIRKSMSQGEIS